MIESTCVRSSYGVIINFIHYPAGVSKSSYLSHGQSGAPREGQRERFSHGGYDNVMTAGVIKVASKYLVVRESHHDPE